MHTAKSYHYCELIENYTQLAPRETGWIDEDHLTKGRPLTRDDYLDIFDHDETVAGQIELPPQTVRDLLAAQTDEQRAIARILICTEILKQLQESLRFRLYHDVSEAIEDEQVNAHFMGAL